VTVNDLKGSRAALEVMLSAFLEDSARAAGSGIVLIDALSVAIGALHVVIQERQQKGEFYVEAGKQ